MIYTLKLESHIILSWEPLSRDVAYIVNELYALRATWWLWCWVCTACRSPPRGCSLCTPSAVRSTHAISSLSVCSSCCHCSAFVSSRDLQPQQHKQLLMERVLLRWDGGHSQKNRWKYYLNAVSPETTRQGDVHLVGCVSSVAHGAQYALHGSSYVTLNATVKLNSCTLNP